LSSAKRTYKYINIKYKYKQTGIPYNKVSEMNLEYLLNPLLQQRTVYCEGANKEENYALGFRKNEMGREASL
jgi:phosphoribosylformylglycinamidine (FGAM) synthase PurS component